MKLLAVMVMSPILLASTCAYANQAAGASASDAASQRITISRGGSQPSGKGPTEYFSGSVRIDPLFPAKAPARASGGRVTFEPGARTAWHSHPLGQILIVTSGAGWIQQ